MLRPDVMTHKDDRCRKDRMLLQHSASTPTNFLHDEQSEDSDDDDQVVVPQSKGRASDEKQSTLPKPIKVYQLLATQSMDDHPEGDRLGMIDRRISLQITSNEDLTARDEADKAVIAKCMDAKLLRPDLIPSAKCHRVASGGGGFDAISCANIPLRKLSSPEDNSRVVDAATINSRPIYPYCPYSPYGSPQGSPRIRRRPLRESRRISVDTKQGRELQLNQYKLLDNIGQVSYWQ